MKKSTLLLLLSLYFLNLGKSQEAVYYQGSGYICPTESWKLVFYDEFEGTELDESKWYTFFPYGPSSQPDQCAFCRTHTNADSPDENQVYLDKNVTIKDGLLSLTAMDEKATWYGRTTDFTSGMIHSKQKFTNYSKYEIRCKIPKGSFFPAFWAIGGNSEIDVFEMGYGNLDLFKVGIIKWDGNNGDNGTGAWIETTDLSNDFHVYSVEYAPFFIVFYLDYQEVYRIGRYLTLAGNPTSCHIAPYSIYLENPPFPSTPASQQVIANLGIGKPKKKGLKCSPDDSTIFPNTMIIDYIRVYQRKIQKDLANLSNNGNTGYWKIKERRKPCYSNKKERSIGTPEGTGKYYTDPEIIVDWSANHGKILGGYGIDIVYVPDTWGKFTLETFAFGPNGDELTVSKDFYVEKCKAKSRNLVVFPNPSSDHIQIRLEEGLDIIPWNCKKKYSYKIVKLSSSMDEVRVGDYFANKTIKTNDLPNGSYMIEIEIDNTPINTTFSINH